MYYKSLASRATTDSSSTNFETGFLFPKFLSLEFLKRTQAELNFLKSFENFDLILCSDRSTSDCQLN